MTETFKYDALDRLDTVMLNGVVSRMVYDSYITTVTNASGGIVQELSYDAAMGLSVYQSTTGNI